MAGKRLVYFILAWCTWGICQAAAENPAIKVSVSVEKVKSEFVATVRLSVDKTVTLYEANLPWGNYHSMTLDAVAVPRGAGAGSPLAPFLICDNPGAAKVTLEKDKVYTGSISLSRFEKLKKAVKERDVILFWSYQMGPLEDGGVSERAGGFVVIKKGS